jgi:hypothetical protein
MSTFFDLCRLVRDAAPWVVCWAAMAFLVVAAMRYLRKFGPGSDDE